jgi:predicted MFS family arabinose efflux permease
MEQGMVDTPSDQATRRVSRDWVVPYIAALFAMMMLQISNLGFSPLMDGIKQSWSMNFSQIGLFMGMNGLASLLMAIPAGLLIQRFGERKVLSIGLMVVAMGLVLVAVSSTFASGMVGRALWQTGYKATFVAAVAALSVTLPLHLRASGMGINGALSSLAAAVGAPLGSRIALHYHWQGGMYCYAGLALLGLVVFFPLYRPFAKPLPAHVSPKHAAGPRPNAFKTPVVWLLSLLMCLGMMVGISLTFFMTTAAKDIYKLSTMDSAAMLSLGFGLGIPLVLCSGLLADRLNNRRLVLAVIMLINAALAMMMIVPSLVVFRISAVLILALGLAVPNLLYALAGQVLSGREVGNVMGTIGLGAGVSSYFGPQMLGLLRDVTGGFAMGWGLMALVSVVSFLIILSLRLK